jgi:hypothetical protein
MLRGESDRTKELRKQLEESIALDKADEWKSDNPAITPEEFEKKWLKQLFVQPGTDRDAKDAGFSHDLYLMVNRLIERANLGHFRDNKYKKSRP